MENNEVVTNVTENVVEQTTEEIVEGVELTDTTDTTENVVEETKEVVKKYDDDDLDKIIAKKLAKQEAKLRKDYEEKLSKYQDTETVLNTGLGTEDIVEATQKMREFYKEQGITMPEPVKPGLSEREIEILAKADAEDIIEDGIDEMTKEANRLAEKGYQNLNNRERVIFNTLAGKLNAESKKNELLKIGVKAEILEEKDFKEFVKQFDPRTPITNIYNLYSKTKEVKETPKPIGSMTTNDSNKVKDFYTYEEMEKLTAKDYENPKIMKAVENSLQKLYSNK